MEYKKLVFALMDHRLLVQFDRLVDIIGPTRVFNYWTSLISNLLAKKKKTETC